MNLLTKLLFVLTAIAALALGVYWQRGQATPDPQFTTITGQTLQLSQLKGKPVILTFWASDCPSCLEEIPHWVKLHQQFAQQGLTIIAVAMAYDPPNKVVELARQQQLPYAIALDPDGQIAQQFGVQLTPSSFLIDPQGHISVRQIGPFDFDAWQQQITRWLNR